MIKIPHGGWFPLVVGALVYLLLTTWKTGRAPARERLRERAVPLDLFLKDIAATPPHRVPGTAVFMTATCTARRRRCCTTSSTTRCCTSASCC